MSFVSLYTGLSGLRSAQVGIDVTSNNIANSGTAGYTRQRVEQSATRPFMSRERIQIGTGVEVTDVTRLRDSFLDNRVRNAIGDVGDYSARADVLGRLETVYGEPDHGISGELNDVWAAFEDLALDPSNPAVRTVAMDQLANMTARVRDVANGAAALVQDTRDTRDEYVTEAQGLIEQIAAINGEVSNLPAREVSNTLLDQRDVFVDRLAELVGSTATNQADGTVTVTVAGETLVDGNTPATLAMVGDDLQVDGTTLAVGSHRGEIGGLRHTISNDLPAVEAELEDFVSSFADAFNAQHAAGFTDSGAPGGALLSYTAGTAGTTIQLTTMDTNALAMKGSATGGAHDAANATALADLRTTPRPDGRSHDEALRETVVGLGSRVAAANRSAGASLEIATTAEVHRTSVHGVSLDEEMVALVQYQRSLEANSRVMTAADQMLDTIVNRLGTVGR